ncbi:tRNA pseudouridine(38-40) synthase TruA [Helicobacter sp.]|uniref:tRNA pseudouridine(38-40) synthase TruA n=1 Tax=Helicobacter sp. TaxID=218 RepID=UPI0025C3B3E3|nr:tRNA pseudouridine(38-40) synthase TruA [Helicobacter sp.]MBR2495160.1 tRNA pseudouridine(38-40) synthase TruA [Helicobacter sp.]
MKYFALKIAYNGAVFSGFAPQRTAGITSVSETLESTLLALGIDSPIVGAGRTDKGVHSLGMIVRICTKDCWESERLYELLVPKLYPHIRLRALWEVSKDFHPRFSAYARSYIYIFSPHYLLPFFSSFIARESLGDYCALQECLQLCVGEHNFAFFSKTGSNPTTTTRIIYSAYISPRIYAGQQCYVVRLVGSGFLRAQVRLLLGACFAVSKGIITKDDFLAQLNALRRSYSIPVDPQGLYFGKAWY